MPKLSSVKVAATCPAAPPGPCLDFTSFYATHVGRLQRYCTYRFGASLGDEVAQLAMERALETFPELVDSGNAWPWLRVVARNIGLNLQRHDQRCIAMEDMASVMGEADRWYDPAEAAEREERRVFVAMALARLSSGQRDVLLLRLRDELSPHAVATLLGTTENTVRQQLFKARRSFIAAYSALSGRTLVLGSLLVAGIRRLVGRREARHSALAVLCTSFVGTVTLGCVLPGAPTAIAPVRDGGLPPRVVSADAATSAVRLPAVRVQVPATTVARPPVAVPPGPVQVRVSRTPLAQGEAASVTVEVPTPVGTVHYRDRTVNGPSGPVCLQAPQLCR